MRWVAVVLVLLFASFLYVALYHGMFGSLRKDYDKECEMTYMWPYFREIIFKEGIGSKYRTYLYREDGLQDLEAIPTGIPVLFIPGHGGSYKQVRSIASEAARMKQSQQYPYDMDFYSVDLNEEFSAIHGPSIVQQAEYISQVIRFIFEDLYHGKIPVHIVGHSMGGIVAAFLFAQPDFPRHYITSIYTYATPWISSPAPITHQIKDIYDRIFETFQDGTLSNISIISFMAGNRDLTVNSELSVIPKISAYSLSVFTSEIPFVWATCDHQGIIWCHQVVRLTVKLLFESFDFRSDSWRPLVERAKIYEKYLLQKPLVPTPYDDDHDVITGKQVSVSFSKADDFVIRDKSFTIFTNQWLGYNVELVLCKDDQCRPFEGPTDGIVSVKVIPGPIKVRRSHLTLITIQKPVERFSVKMLSKSPVLNLSLVNSIGPMEYCTGYLNRWNSKPLYRTLDGSESFMFVSDGAAVFDNVKLGELVTVSSAKTHVITHIRIPEIQDSLFDNCIIEITLTEPPKRSGSSSSGSFFVVELTSGPLGETKYSVVHPSEDFPIKLYHSFHGDQSLYPIDGRESRKLHVRPGTKGLNMSLYHGMGIGFSVRVQRDYVAVPMQLLKRFAMVPIVVVFVVYVAALAKMSDEHSSRSSLRSSSSSIRGRITVYGAILSVFMDIKFHCLVLILPTWKYGFSYTILYFVSFGLVLVNSFVWMFLIFVPISKISGFVRRVIIIGGKRTRSLGKSIFFWSIILFVTPHQYTYTFTFLYHFMTCLGLMTADDSGLGTKANHQHHQHHQILMLWLLTLTVPLYMTSAGLAVWIKNIMINHFTFEGQDLIPSIALICHVMLLRRQQPGCYAGTTSRKLVYGFFCAYLALYGPANPWLMYHGIAYLVLMETGLFLIWNGVKTSIE